jgi:dual-specificity kinase
MTLSEGDVSLGLTDRAADMSDKIVRLLGQGTFGKVVEARHIESRKKVAIKVIRAVQKYRDASKIEIRVLETLKKNDPTNQK